MAFRRSILQYEFYGFIEIGIEKYEHNFLLLAFFDNDLWF